MNSYKLHVDCPSCEVRGLRLVIDGEAVMLVCVECNEVESELDPEDLVMALSAISEKVDEGASKSEEMKGLRDWITDMVKEELV